MVTQIKLTIVHTALHKIYALVIARFIVQSDHAFSEFFVFREPLGS